ncbi:DUF2695 domain-containing protein [Microbacterium sp. A93]|uniref:DUF2695 domain-containing protein n=1 Tax=Microbacterium sp. A93 TaxID=3450716 RepID=UPI003F427291
MNTTPIADQAQKIITNASMDILSPRDGECVLCFTDRQLEQFGCHNTLRFALAYRDLVAPRATALDSRLGAKGGYCDCEIFLNAYQPVRRLWSPERRVWSEAGGEEFIDAMPPEHMPACAGVRKGSTQPCAHWGPVLHW